MSDTSKITKPRMRKGKCTDINTNTELPYEQCLTKGGSKKPKTPKTTYFMIKNGQKVKCTFIPATDLKKQHWVCTKVGEKNLEVK